MHAALAGNEREGELTAEATPVRRGGDSCDSANGCKKAIGQTTYEYDDDDRPLTLIPEAFLILA